MKTIADLKSSLPQIGKIEYIGIRPEKRADVISMLSVHVDKLTGLEGDHYSKIGGKRMITLIQSEHLETMSKILKKDILASMTRRNIVVSGINLLALHDARFCIGEDAILEGTGYCHPCSRMEINLGIGGYNAMRGHGGITARIINGGQIKIGDQVSLLKNEDK